MTHEVVEELADELERAHGDRAIDGLFVHVSGPKMMQIIRALRTNPPATGEVGELVGRMLNLADYFEPNDLSAATTTRKAADTVTSQAAEIARLQSALQSIATSACCGDCQEAALVAQAALRGDGPTQAAILGQPSDELARLQAQVDAMREAAADMAGEFERALKHLDSFAHDHSMDATAETWAILHCGPQSIDRARAALSGSNSDAG